MTNAFQFLHVAEAMAELGRDDLVLEWTSRGIAETDGWQISRLYDAACETNARLEQPLEILRLRRNHHERMPSSSTYAALREAAEQSMLGGLNGRRLGRLWRKETFAGSSTRC